MLNQKCISKTMTRIKPIALVLLLTVFATSLSAQQSQTRRVGSLEFGVGLNFFGPSSQMVDLMEAHGFDDNIVDWVLFEEEEFPHYFPMGFSLQFAYSRIVDPKSKWGVLLHYAWFNKVYGHSDVSGHLDVRFTTVDLIPVYMRELIPSLEMQVGPSLMVNSGRKTSLYNENENESRDWTVGLSPALYAGLTYSIWDGTDTYGKIGASYLLSFPVQMGPFSADYGFGSTQEIPESKIGFSHLNVVFTLGFHLWKYGE